MRNHPQLETLDRLRAGRETVPATDVSQLVRGTCQMLAGAPYVQRVDVTLEPDRETEGKLPLIRQAQGIAREWDLDMYIRLRSGVLRLTFIKQAQSGRALETRNGNVSDRTD